MVCNAVMVPWLHSFHAYGPLCAREVCMGDIMCCITSCHVTACDRQCNNVTFYNSCASLHVCIHDECGGGVGVDVC